MTRNRIFGFFVILACLLVAPLMFADHDHDKDKEKKDKDKASTQQSSSHGDHHASSTDTHSSDRSRDHYTKAHVDTVHRTDVVVHEHVVFDHDHFHARMIAHPDAVARQHAYEHSREERLRFERHSSPVIFLPAHRLILTRVRIVPTTYYYRRTVFYEEYGWRPPMYVYSFYPRYGVWDAVFLAFALDHLADDEYALMFYHHRREAEMTSWLADNRRLAEDNEELRIRLDMLDERMARMEESGVSTDSGYVPPDAQDVALSPEVIDRLTASK